MLIELSITQGYDLFEDAGNHISALERRAAVRFSLAFWAVTFAVLTLRGAFSDFPSFNEMGWRRLVITLVGAALCYGCMLLFIRIRSASFRLKVAVGGMCAIILSIIQSCVHVAVYVLFKPLADAPAPTLNLVPMWAFFWLGYFLAWIGTYLAFAHNRELQRQERKVAAMRETTHVAQLAALRYQLNPHFLFNAINSVVALVGEKAADQAERMLLNLAAFLRATLALDPAEMITLEEEFALQRRYLDIERVRFPERMEFVAELPGELAQAPLPPLLLQPLIENAIRHGVERSSGKVTIELVARKLAGALIILVRNNADAVSTISGTGIGLANVRKRLWLSFGVDARLETTKTGSHFAASVVIPSYRK